MTNRGRRREDRKLIERLTITMSIDLRRALERRADELDSPMGEVARKLLEQQLLKEERV
jgi:hypothetical protein